LEVAIPTRAVERSFFVVAVTIARREKAPREGERSRIWAVFGANPKEEEKRRVLTPRR
jgi:hypothetical protein